MKFKLDQSQLDAIEFAISSRFAIINGGAGVGKTTIIDEIAKRIKDKGKKVALCAFAGKAAARLKEATGIEATTIHRLLNSDGVIFRREHLDDITVIVDESSMVNSELLSEITKRNPLSLILVGDQAQLPPVGAGQPFHDIIALFPEKMKTLTKCYRNTEAVFKAATAIRSGLEPLHHDVSEHEKWDIYNTGSPEQTQHVILEWAKQGFFDFDTDIILCPRNGKEIDNGNGNKSFQPCTVNALNQELIQIINPHKDGEKWKVGDRIINTKNNSEKDIWNGTTGKIHAIDWDKKMWIKLDQPIVDTENSKDGEILYKDKVLLTKEEQKALQHAYALTVHKAQGSQYRRVCVVSLKRDQYNLDRSLVYTAVTRTQKQCVIVGELAAFRQSLQTVQHKETIIQLQAKGAV